MTRSLTISTTAVVFFLLSFYEIQALNTDSDKDITWQELMDSCNTYQQAQDYQTALKWAFQAEDKAKEVFGEMDTNYVKVIGKIPELFYYLDIIDSAIFYEEALISLCRRVFVEAHPELANSINNLAVFYNNKGLYDKAEPLYIEALEITRQLFKSDHRELLISILNIASFYQTIGKYQKAEVFFIEAADMSRRLFKSNQPELAASINEIAGFYDAVGNYDKAVSLHIEALDIYRQNYKTKHPGLAKAINNLAYSYHGLGEFEKAKQLYMEALEMYRQIYNKIHPDIAACLNNLASIYNAAGDYNKAEALLKEALDMRKRIFKTAHPDIAQSTNGLAMLYFTTGNYQLAESYYLEALAMYRSIFKTAHPDLAAIINNMAYFYNATGDYKKAEPFYKEALEMRRSIFKADHPDLAQSINNMALFYYERGDNINAEVLFREALEMKRRLFKTDHPDLANSLNNMAIFLNSMGNYELAESFYVESYEMRNRIYKTGHTDLAQSLNNMASLYENMGNIIKAELLYAAALEMNRRLFRNDHISLAGSIMNMAEFYFDVGEYEKSAPLFAEALASYENIVLKYFPNMSEYEKEQFWKKYKNKFEYYNSFGIDFMAKNPDILSNMLDNHLFTKGLLFNSSGKIKKRILSSGDSVLKSDYTELMSVKDKLGKYYSYPVSELSKNSVNIDSIENIANYLEKRISLKSEDYKQSYENKKINWKSIKTLLKPDEAAIETLRFRYIHKGRFTDSVYYIFLIINNRMEEHPDIVVLENGNLLEGDYFNYYRNMIRIKSKDYESYARYWGKLYEKTKNYKKVYFSADGIYYKLNPATFLLPEGKYLLELQNIHLVNCTKDILSGTYINEKESERYNSAVLIGNPNFSMTVEKLEEAEKSSYTGNSATNRDKNEINNNFLKNLPGTEKEIKEIDGYLKEKKWDLGTYLGDSALKSVVKNVNNPRILHIATHGFFMADINTKYKENFDMDIKRLNENPLLRSGLLFAGSGNYFNTDMLNASSGVNGILTAYEAMNLELDKTELVVLSACETGLGEIRNGEGVYGLQRAFIQAGARSLIMSLWSVSDEATQELMVSFYKEWLGGKTKREAFHLAQMKLKEKYIYPYYWGAFVMVGE